MANNIQNEKELVCQHYTSIPEKIRILITCKPDKEELMECCEILWWCYTDLRKKFYDKKSITLEEYRLYLKGFKKLFESKTKLDEDSLRVVLIAEEIEKYFPAQGGELN